nr:ABC transporter ATP-binding protein [Desulfobulbaceae bacterium]
MKIEFKKVSKKYLLSHHQTLTVFDNLDLVIEDGSFVVIVGESGCGKSTLLHLISGLTSPTDGSILADSQLIESTAPTRTILFQHPSLLPWLTVEENIGFGCKLRGDTYKIAKRTRELVDLIGLNGFEKIHPPKLSIGMAQRVCLARAFISDPRVLLLDEPFASLDLTNRSRLQAKLIEIWQQQKFTAVLVTHDLDEAVSLGQKVFFLGGHPATITSTIDINLPYPRDAKSSSFFEAKRQVLEAFQNTITSVNQTRTSNDDG